MHIRVILPFIGESLLEPVRAEVTGWAAPGTAVDVVSLERGTARIRLGLTPSRTTYMPSPAKDRSA